MISVKDKLWDYGDGCPTHSDGLWRGLGMGVFHTVRNGIWWRIPGVVQWTIVQALTR